MRSERTTEITEYCDHIAVMSVFVFTKQNSLKTTMIGGQAHYYAGVQCCILVLCRSAKIEQLMIQQILLYA